MDRTWRSIRSKWVNKPIIIGTIFALGRAALLLDPHPKLGSTDQVHVGPYCVVFDKPDEPLVVLGFGVSATC